MNIRNQVKEIEAHVKSLASAKNEQIAIITKAQEMLNPECEKFAVLTLAKRRIINS
ncbi:MAG: hypothetical protein IPM52_14535 [Bacteroidetes bacterium]|nr:hypothetical protein [Bacteroidota bacterium]